MHDHKRKRRVERRVSTPAEQRPDSLPTDMIRRAGERLSWAAAIYAVTYTLAYGSSRLTPEFLEIWGGRAGVLPPDFIAVSFVLLGVITAVWARTAGPSPGTLLAVGPLFLIAGAAGIDAWLVWGHWEADMTWVGISWTAVWIVTFPLIVPNTPTRTLAAALVAASTVWVWYFIGVRNGGPPLSASLLVTIILPNYICAGIAVVGARVLYGLGRDIAAAREMGSYQLIGLLGEGGMGEVWKAKHKLLARPAAIKLIKSGGSRATQETTPGVLHRFEREVQATAQLRSPHTVEVYDYGLTEDHTFYYVMELLDGMNLEQLVAEHGPQPAERVVHVLLQVCHSLAEAHEKGLVHRDIKPANIFICRYGRDFDFVKVLDFGLVKQSGGSGNVKLTDVGSFAGTPAYTSPESASGEDVDQRTDVYSLGCVAFWLLAGRTVFESTSAVSMLMEHLSATPPAPSSCAELPVPEALDQLILDCLEKNPHDRPSEIWEVANRLRAVETSSSWHRGRMRAWWDRHVAPTHDVPTPSAPVSQVVPLPKEARTSVPR